MSSVSCPICFEEECDFYAQGEFRAHNVIACERCGSYLVEDFSELENFSLKMAEDMAKGYEDYTALLSYYVRRTKGPKLPEFENVHEKPLVSVKWLESLIDFGKLPPPSEQADNLILFLGSEFEQEPFAWADAEDVKYISIIGTHNLEGVSFITSQLERKGLLEVESTQLRILRFRLSLDGWAKYKSLLEENLESTTVFMAMPFGNEKLDRIYREFYVPTIAALGLRLERVDTNPKAGAITNRMIVEIRRSKLLLAELTGGNNGAYWEAGFAEGIGRPVIYLFEKGSDRRSRGKRRLHFDIRNHQAILWQEDRLEEAMEQLKDAIRATFPGMRG